MSPSPAETKILVTGATGFIALRLIIDLLEAGYQVRGTVRTPSRETKLREVIAKNAGADANARFEIVKVDLLNDEGWPEAVAGCTYVHHVASPLPAGPPKHEDDLIRPAREGALRCLKAASESGSVKRVVMTSSLAAVVYGHDRSDTSRVFDENDWSIPEGCPPYEKSKTLAERAAWEFVKALPEDKKIELVAINPGLVLGPVLEEDYGTSGEAVLKLMNKEYPGCPKIGWSVVDVRDVSAAHISAMTTPEASGERFCCGIEHASFRDIAESINRNFADKGIKVATRPLPDFLIRLLAIFDKTTRIVLHELGQFQTIDNSKIKRVLKWEPRSLDEMVKAMGETMIAFGLVKNG